MLASAFFVLLRVHPSCITQMKAILLQFVAVLLLGSFFSCSQPNPILSQVESIIDDDPEEALSILWSIDNPEDLFSSEDFALYSLLATQAMDKCDVDLTQEPLINNALAYYRLTKDSVRAAKAYFYAGRVAEDSKNTSIAVEYYLRAKELMKNSKNSKDQYSVRFYLGRTYKKQWLRKEQIEITREAIGYARKLENKAFLPLSCYDLAVAFSGDMQYDNALKYLDDAEKYAQIHYKGLLPNIYYLLWYIHNTKGELEEADQYVDSLIKVHPNKSLTHSTIGSRFLAYNEIDSAIVYLRKSLRTKDLNTRASSLWDLGKAFQKQAQYDSATHYLNLYHAVRDSIEADMRATTVMETHKLFDLNRSMEENVVLKEKDIKNTRLHLIYSIIIFVSIILLVLVATWAYLRRKQLKREKVILLDQQENERLKHKAALSELREFLYKQMNAQMLSSLKEEKFRLKDEDWDIIFKNTNDAFDNFIDRLKAEYPAISISDIRLCCLIKMDVNLDVLASIQAVEKKTVYQQKLRLAKDKLKLPDNESLDDFLRKF